jgi:hypothetical protein
MQTQWSRPGPWPLQVQSHGGTPWHSQTRLRQQQQHRIRITIS